MSENGYSATSISMICKRSELPPSSTYWHFGSKEGLLLAVVEHGARRWLEKLPRWSNLEGDPRERIRGLLAAVADSISDDPSPMRLLFLVALEQRWADGRGDDDDPRAVFRKVRTSASNGFRLAFREIFGTETKEARQLCDELTAFALAVCDGAMLAHEIDGADLRPMFHHLGTAFLAIGDSVLGPPRRSRRTR